MPVINGGGSDDVLTGTAADDVINGLGGNDTLNGNGGFDELYGGVGDDRLIATANETNLIHGGDGVDTLVLPVAYNGLSSVQGVTWGAFSGVFFTYYGGTVNVREIEYLEFTDATLGFNIGSTGNDTLTAYTPSLAMYFWADSGDDTVTGGDAIDNIFGGAGADVLNGGQGNDRLFDWVGDNTLSGGAGDDEVFLGAGANIADGGAGAFDYVALDFEDETTAITFSLTNAATLSWVVVGGAQRASVVNFERFALFAGAGNDTISAGVANFVQLIGGGGNDTLTGGANNDVLQGSDGDDVLSGGGGQDTLQGDDGADILGGGDSGDHLFGLADNDTLEGGSGDDTIDGGSGSDIASYAGAASGVAVSLAVAGAQNTVGAGNDTLTGIEGLIGSAFADSLTGDGAANTLDGGSGFDTASYASAGSGVVVSLAIVGAQNTVGAGSDTLTGIEGLIGSAFADSLTGDSAANTLDGGSGDDTLDGGSGFDTASYAGAGSGVVVSLAIAGAQNTVGAGSDTLTGIEGLIGSAFADSLTGDSAANTLDGGSGDDTLNGGSGSDIASYAGAASGVAVSLVVAGAQNTVGAGSDTLTGIEGLTGSAFADSLTGDGAANTLDGGAGDDTLIGGSGDDTLNGGAGFDTASYAGAASGVAVSLAIAGAQNTVGAGSDTLTGIEGLIGSAFADSLTGDGAANALDGGAGDDTLIGGLGDDTLNGGAGFDTASYAGAGSGVVVSLAIAGAQNTVGAGSDTLISIEGLIGSAFADSLTGDGAANTLSGGAGEDTLNGGAGNDTLNGGDGDDRLFISLGDGDVVDGGTGLNAVVVPWIQNTSGWGFGWGSNPSAQITLYSSSVNSFATNVSVIEFADGERVGLVLGNLGGNVLVAAQPDLEQILLGGDGNDSITGGNQDDFVSGDAGQDSLYGGAGNDTLFGMDGDDVLEGGAGLFDHLGGGSGVDIASYASAGSGVAVSLAVSGAQDTLGAGNDTLDSIEGLTGSAFADSLTGDGAANTLNGGAGADTLNGGGGDDRLHVSAGDNDVLNGGAGSDTAVMPGAFTGPNLSFLDDPTDGVDITFDAATIRLLGVEFMEFSDETYGLAIGTSGADTLVAPNAALRTYFFSGLGNDSVTGGNNADRVIDLGGANTINGGGGDDLIYARAFAGSYDGGAGTNDELVITGSGAFDITLSNTLLFDAVSGASVTLAGFERLNVGIQEFDALTRDIDGSAATVALSLTTGDGNDTILGGSGGDILDGREGDDVLEGRAGTDLLFGRGGLDTASYAGATAGVTVNLAVTTLQATGGAGSDQLFDMENLLGSAFNDTLTGNGSDNVIEGGLGNDDLLGGAGVDSASYATAAAGVAVQLALAGFQATGGAGSDRLSEIENLIGSAFNDVLTGNGSSNTIEGGLGDDLLEGGAGDDALFGGGGVDTASYAGAGAAVTVQLAVTNAQVTGGAGSDQLFEIENLLGSAFNDTLAGDQFDNRIEGGAGADVLNGSTGFDTASYTDSGVGVFASLASGTGANGTAAGDTLAGFEALLGSSFGDTLIAGIAGAARVDGAGGDDYLSIDADDVAIGGAGYDTVFVLGSAGLSLNLAGAGIERVFGVHGANDALDASGASWDVTLWGQGGADVLKGGSGDDYLYFDEADLSGGQVSGGAGYDWALNYTSGPLSPMLTVNMATLGIEGYYGSGGNETISAAGIATSVTIYANLGADQITGGSGSDYLYTTHETASVQGGAGYDYAIFNENGFATTLNLATSGIEGAVGRNGNDVLNGAACVTSVSLYGNDGADQLLGGAGDDYLYFDETDVAGGVLAGGAGYDYLLNYTFTTPSALLTVNMAALGAEGYQGNAGAERVDASGCLTSVSLYGEGGADQLIGGAGDDYIYFDLADLGAGGELAGGAGYDYAVYNVASGDATLELASRGFEGAVGRDGNDSFDASGSSVSASLYGYGGNDTLKGGSATDYLYGDAGNDTLTGGAGADYFVTYAGWGADTVTDFENGLDRVILSSAGPASFAQLILSQDGADAVASYNGNSIRFLDTLVAELDASDFLF